jgi:hypothetical protein
MARVFVDSVVERGERPLDAGCMRATFDRFWARHRWNEEFNNTLLRPLTKPGQLLLMAQYGSTALAGDDSPQQALADRFATPSTTRPTSPRRSTTSPKFPPIGQV